MGNFEMSKPSFEQKRIEELEKAINEAFEQAYIAKDSLENDSTESVYNEVKRICDILNKVKKI
jgi:hypothetical protein